MEIGNWDLATVYYLIRFEPDVNVQPGDKEELRKPERKNGNENMHSAETNKSSSSVVLLNPQP